MLKIPLRATPHSVVFDAENEVLAVMVSVKVKDMVRYLKPAGDDRKDKEREQEMLERGEDPENIVYNEADGTYILVAHPYACSSYVYVYSPPSDASDL